MKTKQPCLLSVVDLKSISGLVTATGQVLYQKSTDILHKILASQASFLVKINASKHQKQLLATSAEGRIDEDILEQLERFLDQQLQDIVQEQFLIASQAYLHGPEHTYMVKYRIEGYLSSVIHSPADGLCVLISLTTSPIKTPDILFEWHQLISSIIVQNQRQQHITYQTDVLLSRLNYEVSHDHLTNLKNRSFLADTLERLILTPHKYGSFSLGILDINGFKSINDLYGSYTGDQVLKYVARSITDTIQDEAFTFRTAGDEFAFIIFDADPMAVCHRILGKISQGYRDTIHHIRVSVCIGLTTYPQESTDADQLMLNASLALKDGKSHNRQISCYNTQLSECYYRKVQLVETLREVLNQPGQLQQELYVVLQPIIRRRAYTRWDYFEVLARWQSPVFGNVSPGEFIIASEHAGLIVELGKRVIELACEVKMQIEQALNRKIRFSINCSAQELNQSQDYIHFLLKQTEKYGFHPAEFTIEITETALLAQSHEAKNILTQLRGAGFKVALDDFGTGYSSLNYIHNYPIDGIKIDASFIKNILHNETSEKVVNFIIQLANQLNIDLVAEGVEDPRTLAKVYDMGCNQIQGYLFSKPIPPEKVIQYLFSKSFPDWITPDGHLQNP
jgi:diguanylate cyclase (GGDEF)-like protein